MISCIYCHETTHQKKDGFNPRGVQRFHCLHFNRKYTLDSTPRAAPNRYPDVIECIECAVETTNPRFCSRNCAARYNNRMFPKRKSKKFYCKYCGIEVGPRKAACPNCNPWNIDWSQRIIGELRRTADYQANARVRYHSRVVYKSSNRPKCCQRCGYDKYYEVCHIHAISEFPDEALVREVNDIDNLIGLCPNCHWEFDHGLLGFENGAFIEMRGAKRYSHVKRTE
jgi:5-methylcytosine-specific restriction endonuclease McrA